VWDHRPPAQARPGPSAVPSALVPSLQQKTTESIRSITTQSIKLDRTPRIISSNRWCRIGRHVNPAGSSAFAEQAGCTDVSKEGVTRAHVRAGSHNRRCVVHRTGRCRSGVDRRTVGGGGRSWWGGAASAAAAAAATMASASTPFPASAVTAATVASPSLPASATGGARAPVHGFLPAM